MERLLYEASSIYGKNIIKQYSEKLMVEVGKKYNERTLYRMRKFYEVFKSEKLRSHYILLLSLKNEDEIIYYINITINNNLNKRGISFTYVGNEYKIKLDDRYNYIDLLLYNIKYKCYVVVELKVTELKEEHTGQIMTYMNYIDKNIKTIEENDTVGIIICKQDNEYVIKYCFDNRIIAREYELV